MAGRMQPETLAVLQHIVAHPGVSQASLRVQFRGVLRMSQRLQALRESSSVRAETSGEQRVYFATEIGLRRSKGERVCLPGTGVRVTPKPPPAAPRHVGTPTPGRLVSLLPWPEPYLPDSAIRSSGLEFRECGSRRGDRLVYCYRR